MNSAVLTLNGRRVLAVDSKASPRETMLSMSDAIVKQFGPPTPLHRSLGQICYEADYAVVEPPFHSLTEAERGQWEQHAQAVVNYIMQRIGGLK